MTKHSPSHLRRRSLPRNSYQSPHELASLVCGFAPGSAADVNIDEVYVKLQNEVAAARRLREKHG